MASKVMLNRIKRGRTSLIIFIICVIFIIGRLAYLMIVKGPQYQSMAKSRQYKSSLIMPSRGTIYDISGKELAVSVPIYDMWIELSHINQMKKKLNKAEDAEKILEDVYKDIIATIEVEDKEGLKEKLNSEADRLILIPALDFESMKKIRDLKIDLIWFDEKTKRVYPYGRFASSVLGHVSNENVGLAGIENYLDIRLKGIPGRRIYLQDANGKKISVEDIEYYESINGENLILNIDEVIQHNLDTALLRGYETYMPKSATGIVMETKTGNILGMSSIPDYNSNLPFSPAFDYYANLIEEKETTKEKTDVLYEMWRNRCVNDAFEPGSPFKIITAAAALEENLTYPTEIFHDKGFIEIEDIPIHNYGKNSYGDIEFRKAFAYSLNTPFIEFAQRLGKEKLNSYIKAFGFGKKTGIYLPGEFEGLVMSNDEIGPVELANISFGQGISVTPIQLITAINAIGNGGKLMRPHIVNTVLDKDGNTIKEYKPEVAKQVISKKTADTLLSFMESVVIEGTGKTAAIDGYRVAGKTGTANKVEEGGIGYSEDKYVTTFVCMAPVEDPALTILIILDEPKVGETGSFNAAPIAKEVLESSLKYLGINQSSSETQEDLITVPDLAGKSYEDAIKILGDLGLNPVFEENITVEQNSHIVSNFPQANEKVQKNSHIMLYMKSNTNNLINMPDLTGKTKEQAETILGNLNLTYAFSGSGKVSSQNPISGTILEEGSMVNIVLK